MHPFDQLKKKPHVKNHPLFAGRDDRIRAMRASMKLADEGAGNIDLVDIFSQAKQIGIKSGDRSINAYIQEAAIAAQQALDVLDWPLPPKIEYNNARKVRYARHDETQVVDAEILFNVKIATVSGLTRDATLPVHISAGQIVPPSTLLFEGRMNVLAQSTVNDIVHRNTSYYLPPLRKQFSPPLRGADLDTAVEARNLIGWKERETQPRQRLTRTFAGKQSGRYSWGDPQEEGDIPTSDWGVDPEREPAGDQGRAPWEEDKPEEDKPSAQADGGPYYVEGIHPDEGQPFVIAKGLSTRAEALQALKEHVGSYEEDSLGQYIDAYGAIYQIREGAPLSEAGRRIENLVAKWWVFDTDALLVEAQNDIDEYVRCLEEYTANNPSTRAQDRVEEKRRRTPEEYIGLSREEIDAALNELTEAGIIKRKAHRTAQDEGETKVELVDCDVSYPSDADEGVAVIVVYSEASPWEPEYMVITGHSNDRALEKALESWQEAQMAKTDEGILNEIKEELGPSASEDAIYDAYFRAVTEDWAYKEEEFDTVREMVQEMKKGEHPYAKDILAAVFRGEEEPEEPEEDEVEEGFAPEAHRTAQSDPMSLAVTDSSEMNPDSNYTVWEKMENDAYVIIDTALGSAFNPGSGRDFYLTSPEHIVLPEGYDPNTGGAASMYEQTVQNFEEGYAMAAGRKEKKKAWDVTKNLFASYEDDNGGIWDLHEYEPNLLFEDEAEFEDADLLPRVSIEYTAPDKPPMRDERGKELPIEEQAPPDLSQDKMYEAKFDVESGTVVYDAPEGAIPNEIKQEVEAFFADLMKEPVEEEAAPAMTAAKAADVGVDPTNFQNPFKKGVDPEGETQFWGGADPSRARGQYGLTQSDEQELARQVLAQPAIVEQIRAVSQLPEEQHAEAVYNAVSPLMATFNIDPAMIDWYEFAPELINSADVGMAEYIDEGPVRWAASKRIARIVAKHLVKGMKMKAKSAAEARDVPLVRYVPAGYDLVLGDMVEAEEEGYDTFPRSYAHIEKNYILKRLSTCSRDKWWQHLVNDGFVISPYGPNRGRVRPGAMRE